MTPQEIRARLDAGLHIADEDVRALLAAHEAAIRERDSLRLELDAERHCHLKDNEHLIRERDEAMECLGAGRLYGPDGPDGPLVEVPTDLVERAKMCALIIEAEKDHAEENGKAASEYKARAEAAEARIRELEQEQREAFRAGFLATVGVDDDGRPDASRWAFDGPAAADREPEAYTAWRAWRSPAPPPSATQLAASRVIR